MLLQDCRCDFGGLKDATLAFVSRPNRVGTYLLHHLDDGVSEKFRTCFAELQQCGEPRIWVAEDTVTVSRSTSEHLYSGMTSKTMAYPGTTWPLLSVFQRNSLMWSWLRFSPNSLRMLSCQRNTSWLANLIVHEKVWETSNAPQAYPWRGPASAYRAPA